LSFLLFILFKYNIFRYQRGFRYPDVLLNISASIDMFLLFGSSNFNIVYYNKYY
jgi:hypothetical protein